MDALFQIVIIFALAAVVGAFLQGLFSPVRNGSDGIANDSNPSSVNKSTPSDSNQSVLQGWRESRWFWNVSQFLFVLSLKIVTVIVLVSLEVDVANEATSLLPILFNVWLSRYLVFKRKLNLSRWVIGGVIYFAQVMLGLSIGIFSA